MAERLCEDRHAQVQMCEFVNLTTELLVGQRGPKVQLEGMQVGVKVKKTDTYDGTKGCDLDNWLFEVREHLNLTVIPEWGYVQYTALLLHGNAALWWHEACESNRRPTTWEDFCHILREQFWPEDYKRCGRDELAEMR